MDKCIKNILYMIAVVFIAMIIYFGNFLVYHTEDYISSSHNPRLKKVSENVIRGSVYSSDNEVLAMTQVDMYGNEERVYPFGNMFAHCVGYSTKGNTGIEAIGNFYMVNSHESSWTKMYNNLHGIKHSGDNIYTSLNAQLQQVVYDAIGDEKGACVVMEPDTGRILAMVSKPDFDPNTLVENWDSFTSDNENSCLLNRTTRGLYPPGSSFKIMTSLEFIREYPNEYETYKFDCEGETVITDDYSVHCSENKAHGELDFGEALAESCNCSFADIGIKLDKEKFTQTCNDFLFNQTIQGSYGCAVSSFELANDTNDVMTVQTVIGQGRTLMTPIHNALIFSAIANGGTMMTPYVIERVESQDGKIIKEFYPKMQGQVMTAEEADILAGMLKNVINEGTASILKNDNYQVAGKSGSAQYSSVDKNSTHAWFVGYAPVENPKVVVCVVVEEGGSGGIVSASKAKNIFDAYFELCQ